MSKRGRCEGEIREGDLELVGNSRERKRRSPRPSNSPVSASQRTPNQLFSTIKKMNFRHKSPNKISKQWGSGSRKRGEGRKRVERTE